MKSQPIRFIRRGEVVTLTDVPPTRTLLEVLREDLGCTGTKEGCNEGDCGACTVVVAENDPTGLTYRAINSCIRLAHSIDGMALFTVEDIAPTLHRTRGSLAPKGAHFALGRQGDETIAPASDSHLHPVQQAMVDCHGSQCGFCTPGFVMSLFCLYQNEVCKGRAITREAAKVAVSGNLCRCTGYRPILDAAQRMTTLPVASVNEVNLLSQLELIKHKGRGLEANLTYISPKNLSDLLKARSAYLTAQIVAGCTDVGLWITKQHRLFDQVLDVTRVAELRRVERYPHHIAIGAAVPLTDAFAALVADRPQLQSFANRFAGQTVRNSGTLGGNVANGSPIGDSMPLLIALGANVVLMSHRKGSIAHRELPLEKLYTGYRTHVMAADEVLAWIKVPKPAQGETSRVYKISKRFEDDISAVCLAVNLRLEAGQVANASIGAGGVAATPVRAVKTETALVGQAWNPSTVERAIEALRREFQPISDMRASASYRSEVLGNLLQRFWLESQGTRHVNLEAGLDDLLALEGELT